MRRACVGLGCRLAAWAIAVPLALGACGGPPAPRPPGTPAATGLPAAETGPQQGLDPDRFGRSTTIDNPWLPLRPGTQLGYRGTAVERGRRVSRELVRTVTDLTKLVGGVPTVVVWDLELRDGTPRRSELAFFAQADTGDVWQFGRYPEMYEDGKLVEAPAWMHGFEGARAGITSQARPRPATASYSQGWAPAIGWAERARVHRTGQRTCLPARCYDGVLVTDEFSQDEPGARTLRYSAPGVGPVRLAPAADAPTGPTLELSTTRRLAPDKLGHVRREALRLEQRAYTISPDAYARTSPMGPVPR